MADALQNIKDEIIAAVTEKHPDVLSQVKMEMTLAAVIEAIDGKGTALNTIYNIWKANKGKKGTLNKSNSWIAYGVGLTALRPQDSVDPLPWRRAFARAGFPDIDSDFEDERREEVIDHIVATYGRENVGNIGTYGTLHMKSVVRALVKVIDAAGAYYKGKDAYRTDNKIKGDEIIAALPKPQGAKLKWTTDDGEEVEIKTVQDAYTHVPDFRRYMDKYPDIMRFAKHIEGLSSQFSTHASGIIIANEPLSGLAPLRPVEKTNWKGEKIKSFSTQFPYEDCETNGLIKFDVLAIKMLSIVKQCCELIKRNWEIDIDIENLPLTDAKTFRMFQTGNLTGVFQCEGYGMQKTCRDMGIPTFDDIMAAIALYRPGPMVSIPEYIARKHGEKAVEYFHPSLEKYTKKVLERTYGLLVYQEQVMLLCNALAGFSISDAYQIIKAIGKKKMDLMLKFRTQFVDGCVAKGIDRNVAEQYWDKFIVPFADYGFNASHSCCYGYNAYLTAYLKANYRVEYLTASLNVEAARKKWEKVAILEKDCDRNGIELLKRDINKCGMVYEIVSQGEPAKGIRPQVRPAILCQGLSHQAAENIVANAPYKSLRDFSTRTASCVDTTSVAALADAGFFPKGKGDQMVKEFEAFRSDLKKANKRGVVSDDMFEGLKAQ